MLMFAVNHFTKLEMMSQYAASKHIPFAKLSVLGSGLLLVIGGLSLLTGYYPQVGLGALALFFLGVTPMMHNFWSVSDPQMKMSEMTNFLKNFTIFGLVLMLYLTTSTVWPYSL